MRAFVFLRDGAVDFLTDVRWPPPQGAEPGGWVDSPICCAAEDLVWWFDEELWEVEVAGEPTVERRRLRADRGRLLRRIETWTPEVAREFVATCEARVRDREAASDGAELDGFATDVVRYASEAPSAAEGAGVGAYVAAHAIAGGDKRAEDYGERFEEERAWQVGWLRERLRL
jgi:hypothetical protein